MHTITLFLVGGSWLARTTDPQVIELFGTDTLPTPYTEMTPADVVLRRVRNLNPDARVSLGDAHG